MTKWKIKDEKDGIYRMDLERVIAVRTNRTVYYGLDAAIKIFARSYSTCDVLAEAANLTRARKLGIDVPNLIEVTHCGDRWAIVTEFIEGEIGTLEDVFTVQRRLRETSGADFPDGARLAHRALDEAPLYGDVKDALRARITELIAGDTLCHANLEPSNIIRSDGKLYVLGWKNAVCASPIFDEAMMHLTLGNTHPGDIIRRALPIAALMKMKDAPKHERKNLMRIIDINL